MDREKTYFRSAMERISPQKIKDQMGTDKFRRTSQFMALNTCVMDKTAVIEHDNLSHTKATNSFKKLPNNSF
jgi:IS1 family transposase